MFEQFLDEHVGPDQPRSPRRTTSPTSTAGPGSTASVRSSPRVASTCPRATATSRPGAGSISALGNRKNERVPAAPPHARASRPTPARSGCSTISPASASRSRWCRRRATPVRCSRPPGWPTLRRRRRRRRGRRTRHPRQAGARPVPRRRRAARRAAGPGGRRRGCGRPASPPGGRAASGWSSASTAAPAGRRCAPTAPTSSSSDLAELVPTANRSGPMRHRAPEHLPLHRYPHRPVAARRAGVRQVRHRADRDAVRRGQRLHRDARQPGGRAATPTATARTSTRSTRPGTSTTPRRRSGSPRPARRSSTSPTPS